MGISNGFKSALFDSGADDHFVPEQMFAPTATGTCTRGSGFKSVTGTTLRESGERLVEMILGDVETMRVALS